MTIVNPYVFNRLEISGYKSIQDVVIKDIPPLMVLMAQMALVKVIL